MRRKTDEEGNEGRLWAGDEGREPQEAAAQEAARAPDAERLLTGHSLIQPFCRPTG